MKYPKHAKRVFKGIIFDVYQWQQKMFDGSHKTFEKIERQNTVVIFATVKNKLVLLKQKQPGTGWFITNPSGRMDVPGESPKQAAARELLEETGMVAKKLFLWKKIQTNGKIIFTTYIFIARDCEIVKKQKLDSGEKISVFYSTFDDFLKLTDDPKSEYWLSESLPDMFRAILDKKFKAKYKKAIFG